MNLPVQPPIAPMLARLVRELPGGDYVYEPKWDGFRCLAFRDGDEVDLRSRHDRPLARYFPELVEGMRSVEAERFVVDGEIVLAIEDGFDFAALMARLHPAASRVALLSRERPAAFVAFDLLALGAEDARLRSFVERRSLLTALFADPGAPLYLTPATEDESVARAWLERFEGVIAKGRDLEYRAGLRAMVKVKRERTADCVVAGFRWLVERPLPSSLLLGLYDDAGELQHVGVASSFTERQRHLLLEEIAPLVAPLAGHPWEHGFLVGGSPMGRLKGAAGRWTPDMEQDWTPLAPVRVCEVAYDQLDRDRFRHPARFRRWRPDRDPRSCTFDQLEYEPTGLAELLSAA
jgi:ATP-dependent DNA ligase